MLYMSNDSGAYFAAMTKHISQTGLFFIVYEMSDASDYCTIARNIYTDVIYDINMGRIHFQRYKPYMVVGIIDQNKISTTLPHVIHVFDSHIKEAVGEFKKRFELPGWIDEQKDLDEFVLLCARWTEEQDRHIESLDSHIRDAAKKFRREYMRRS